MTVSAMSTNEPVTTEEFLELQKLYDMAGGTYVEFTNPREARVAFAQAMQIRGYRLDANRTWLKAGCCAAVMEPR